MMNRWRGEYEIDNSKIFYLLNFIIGAVLVVVISKMVEKINSSLKQGFIVGILFIMIFVSCLALSEFPAMDKVHSDSIVDCYLNKIGITGFMFSFGSLVFIIVSYHAPSIISRLSEHSILVVLQIASTVGTATWAMIGVALTIIWAQKGWIGETATELQETKVLANYMGGFMLTLKGIASAGIYTISLILWVFKPCFEELVRSSKECGTNIKSGKCHFE